MSRKKKTGFGTLGKRKHRALSAEGGSKRVPKGFSFMSEEQRREAGRKGAEARWHKLNQGEDNEHPTEIARTSIE